MRVLRVFNLHQLRADKAVGTVSAISIVIHFYVFEYRFSHFVPGGKSLTMNGLHLERVKEALGTGIVIAITLGAHAAQQAVLFD